MPRGRPPNKDKPVNWRLSLPESLAVKFELLVYDPSQGKVGVGLRSSVVSELIRKLLDAAATGNTTQDLSTALNMLPIMRREEDDDG